MNENTTQRIQKCLDHLRDGDANAKDQLLDTACKRLERLARKMLRDFPRLRRWEETADVLQNGLIRLVRALEQIAPITPREFFSLASRQLRWELIDLARHYAGELTKLPGQPRRAGAEARIGPPNLEKVAEPNESPDRLLLWTEFHVQATELPDAERETFDLLWYQGLSQKEAAEILGISERAIRSRWRAARLKLHQAMGGCMPEG